MTVLPPRTDQPRFTPQHESQGKPAAMIVWILYVLALPSANLLAIVGVVVAVSARTGTSGLARLHLDRQVRLFWTSALINIVLLGICMASIAGMAMEMSRASWLLPTAILSGLALGGLTLWFTIRSAIAAFNLSRDRAP